MIDRDPKLFRLRDLGRVDYIAVESVIPPDGDDERVLDEIDILVKTESGATLQALRISVPAGGGLHGHWTPVAKLLYAVSWDDREGDDLQCPLCHMQGHGAGACEIGKGEAH